MPSKKGKSKHNKLNTKDIGKKSLNLSSFYVKTKKKIYSVKGYWYYCNNQKIFDSNEQGNITKNLISGDYDNEIVRRDAYNIKSNIDIIREKIKSGGKLNKKEQIIYDNELNTYLDNLNKDMKKLNKEKQLAKDLKTVKGKTKKLLLILRCMLKKENVNKEDIFKAYSKFKHDNLEISNDLADEFSNEIDEMNRISNSLGNKRVELQFLKFYNNMPPLNHKKFKKLEPFQRKTILNIDQNISTIISAPTSAGKTWLMAYIFSKLNVRILVCVPRDPLAFQLCSYIQKITGEEATLVTSNWKSHPNPEELYRKVFSNRIMVGTPKDIQDILLYKCYESENGDVQIINWDYLIVDEIHLIGDDQCVAVENILKRYSDVTTLGLSATIPNAEEFLEWMKKIGHKNSEVVKCTKKFFNSRLCNYNSVDNEMENIHPLSMVSIEDFITGNVINMDLSPTPPDIWDLVTKLSNCIDLGELSPYNVFIKNGEVKMIELGETIEYFKNILKLMVSYCNDNKRENISKIYDILKSYDMNKINTNSVDLLKLITNLKTRGKNDNKVKLPALIFNKNREVVLKMARNCARQILLAEEKKYPNRQKDLDKKNSKLLREYKKREKGIATSKDIKYEDNKPIKYKKINGVHSDNIVKKKKAKVKKIKNNQGMTDKERIREGRKGNNVNDDILIEEYLKPHIDFTYNESGVHTFNMYDVKRWIEKFSNSKNGFFPNNGNKCHYIFDLLQRNIGIYVKGLPANYLREVHKLTSQKKLQIIFCDTELIFGISLPIRSFVFVNDKSVVDDLDPMMAKQGSGRAGRRGHDNVAFTIYAGYSSDRIKELQSSPIPPVLGQDTRFYSFENMMKIVKDPKWDRIKKDMLSKNISDEDANNFYNGISDLQLKDIADGGWSFSLRDDWQFNYLCTILGYSVQCFRVGYLLEKIRKIFCNCDPNLEKNQLQLYYLLLHFINVEECEDENDILPNLQDIRFNNDIYDLLVHSVYLGLNTDFPKKLLSITDPITYRKKINGSLYFPLRENRLKFNDNTIIIRSKLDNFYRICMVIQHYFFDKKDIVLARLFGKSLTRIYYILMSSNPAIEQLNTSSYNEEYTNFKNSSSNVSINEVSIINSSNSKNKKSKNKELII
jgi:hypothetical protein